MLKGVWSMADEGSYQRRGGTEEGQMEQDTEFIHHGEMPKLLLVEDNPLHVRLVKSMLADVWPGAENLRAAKRLDRAVELVTTDPPECVLLDLILPDADGLDSVKAILAVAPQVPIVVLSSHEDDELALQAVKEGAQDYLVKGTIGPDGLARAIHFAIQRHRLDRPDEEVAEIPKNEMVDQGPVAVLDANGTILFAEPALAQLLGRTLAELVGVPLQQISHPNDAAGWERVVSDAARTPELTMRLRHASGNDLKVRIELNPLANGEGTRAAYLARYYPMAEVGTVSSGGVYAVMTEWVGG